MKPHGVSSRHHQVLSHLSAMPKKILALCGEEHTSEFVLHELCNQQCFNLLKAAYFVDNPDFDCLRGIAGYNQEEHEVGKQDFPAHLTSCQFNKKVQSVARSSCKKSKKRESEFLDELSRELMIKNPRYYSWPLKHDNVGILIYEISSESEDLSDCIQDGLHLLGFCALH
jgi:hypothetical protein